MSGRSSETEEQKIFFFIFLICTVSVITCGNGYFECLKIWCHGRIYFRKGGCQNQKAMIMSLPLSKLGSESLVTLTLPPNYGYCILVAVGSVGVLAWKAAKVEDARKLYKIAHPIMYSDTNNHFNCVQRAHQNTLENYPQFLSMLLLGGLDSPILCASGGVVYLLGRIAYAHGYYTGDPKRRTQGLFGHAGLIIMLGATVKLAVKLLLRTSP